MSSSHTKIQKSGNGKTKAELANDLKDLLDKVDFLTGEIRRKDELINDLKADNEKAASGSEALRVSEGRYRGLFDAMQENFSLTEVIVDEQGSPVDYIFLDANPALGRYSGISREMIVGRKHSDFMAARGGEAELKWFDIICRVALTGNAESGDHYAISTGRWAQYYAFSPKHGQCAVLSTDITEQKHAWEVSAQFAAIVESSRDAIISKTPDGVITSWNRGAERLYGYKSDEILGRSISILSPPDRPDESRQILDKIKAGEGIIYYDTKRVRKDGSLFDVSLTVSPIKDKTGRIIGAATIARDITERKQIEESLMLDEARLEALIQLNDMVDASEDELFDFALEHAIKLTDSKIGDINTINADETLAKIQSITKEVMDGCEVDAPADFNIVAGGLWTEIFRTRRTLIINDYAASHPSKKGLPAGHLPLTRILEVPVFEQDHILAICIVGNKDTDYTDADARQLSLLMNGLWRIIARKRADIDREQIIMQLAERTAELQNANEELEANSEELATQAEEIESANEELRANNKELLSITASLREAGDYLDSLINYANAPIIVWDPRFTITRFNHAFERLSGYKADEVMGSHLSILFPPDSIGKSLRQIQKTLAGEQWESVEIPIRHKYGSIHIALWNSANIYGADKKLLATIAQGQDITERKRFESELSEAKLQTELYLDLMGHDISNMHQVAIGQLELAQDLLKTDGKIEAADGELIDSSLESLWRSARLIDNVRKLQKIKSDEIKNKPISLDELLVGVVKQYDRSNLEKMITISIGKGVHVVRANELLRDVFTNLISNAIKHSNGRTVDIQVKLEDVMDNDKKYYQVSIEDNGPGIPDDMKDKVFNRLQRGETKARGMGLGLYLVKSLVDSYRGKVWVENRVPGDHTKGSRFIVLLPTVGDFNGH